MVRTLCLLNAYLWRLRNLGLEDEIKSCCCFMFVKGRFVSGYGFKDMLPDLCYSSRKNSSIFCTIPVLFDVR